MDTSSIAYLVFGIVLLVAIVLDLGLLSRNGSVVTMKRAVLQTGLWISLALAFAIFLRLEKGSTVALEYAGAYVMEWSLSIDNIFVFILIFRFFAIKPVYYGRVLMIGILLAILLRIVFITVGITAVTHIHWLLYVFGAFLVYTGVAMFRSRGDRDRNIEDNQLYKILKRLLPLTPGDGDGR